MYICLLSSPEFPLGAKTTYRAYSCDTAYEILDRVDVQLNDEYASANKGCPFIPIQVEVRSYPEPCEAFPSGGCSLLKSWPTGQIHVMPFVTGSRAELDATVKTANRVYNADAKVILYLYR